MILIPLNDSVMYIKLVIVLNMSAKMICGSVKLLIKNTWPISVISSLITLNQLRCTSPVVCSQRVFCNKKMSVYGFCIILHAQTFFYQTVIQANKNNHDKIHFFCCDTVDSVAEHWHQYSILDFFRVFFYYYLFFTSDTLK